MRPFEIDSRLKLVANASMPELVLMVVVLYCHPSKGCVLFVSIAILFSFVNTMSFSSNSVWPQVDKKVAMTRHTSLALLYF